MINQLISISDSLTGKRETSLSGLKRVIRESLSSKGMRVKSITDTSIPIAVIHMNVYLEDSSQVIGIIVHRINGLYEIQRAVL